MNRREALSATALLLGGTMVGASTFLSGCKRPVEQKIAFDPDDISFLDEVGETIIPTTPESPGAKAARIGEFMKTMVNDCYSDGERKTFLDGMATLQSLSDKHYHRSFTKLTVGERHDLLTELDKEASAFEPAEGAPSHYFTMLKQLTVWGYFTSEPGCTQALRYIAIPGRFEGCLPYKAGEKAWAT